MKADTGVRGQRPTPGLCENLVLLRLALLTWEALPPKPTSGLGAASAGRLAELS